MGTLLLPIAMIASLLMHCQELIHTLVISLQDFQDILRDITNSVQSVIDDIQSSPAPEATAYLRLLGNEIGYMKTSEMRKMADTLFMYYHIFMRILPAQVRPIVS